METQTGMCCGLTEVNGLSGERNPKSALLDLLFGGSYDGFDNDGTGTNAFRGSFILFTGAGKGKRKVAYAERFRKFIEENRLGTVKVTEPVKNTNSGNVVTLYVWEVNHKALNAWRDANDPDRAQDEADDEPDTTNDNW